MTSAKNRETRTPPDRAAYAVAALLAGLSGLIAWDAAHISSSVASYSRIGAAAFPYAIAILLMGCAIGTAISAWRGNFPDREPIEFGPVAWVIGGLLAQIILIGFAGFSIATGFLFGLAARGFGGKPLWLTIPIGIVFAFVLYVLFAKGLQLSLPRGPLERLI